MCTVCRAMSDFDMSSTFVVITKVVTIDGSNAITTVAGSTISASHEVHSPAVK